MLQKKKSSYVSVTFRFLVYLTLLVTFHGCTSIPRINQPSYQDTSLIKNDCREIFPHGNWRFVHSIQVNMAGKKRTKLIGITQVDSESRSLHSVLMTIEGMVVFEAKYENQDTTVKRATTPFDSPHFAKGLIQDVKLIFLPPQDKCIDVGLTNDDQFICRYRTNSSRTKDIHVSRNKRKWSVYLYDKGKKTRTLSAMYNNSTPESSIPSHPKRLNLRSYNSHNNYSLKMELIEAKQLTTR